MTKREKGVATAECPRCGAELPIETRADGATAPARCESCFPAATEPAKETAAVKAPAREKGTTEETGDDNG